MEMFNRLGGSIGLRGGIGMDSRLSRLLYTMLEPSRPLQRAARRFLSFVSHASGGGEVARLDMLSRALLSSPGEASGLDLAQEIIARYGLLADEEKVQFFLTLAEKYAPDQNM